MNDLASRFLAPACPAQRQYEALRAHCVDGLPTAEAAARFDYSHGTFRNLLSAFRRDPGFGFFAERRPGPKPAAAPPAADAPDPLRLAADWRRDELLSVDEIVARLRARGLPGNAKAVNRALRAAGFGKLPRRSPEQRARAVRPLQAALADHRKFSLAPRRFRTPFGGLFLFLPLLAELDFDRLATACGLPGSARIPAGCACRALLALKLWGAGRPGHLMAEAFDEGPALFASLNAVPKRSTLGEYACRIDPRVLPRLNERWFERVEAAGLSRGDSFDLDFHAVPHHGADPVVEKHYVPKRSRRRKGVLTFLARDADSRVFRHADATVRKADRAGAALRFAELFRKQTGAYPVELVFDSTLTTHAELAKLHARGIRFLTLRQRHKDVLRPVLETSRESWKTVELHNIGRAYRRPRTLDQRVKLPGWKKPLRQIAVDNLGHDKPVLLLTNSMQESAGKLVDRYARRMLIENAIAEAIDFFHMDALSSAAPLKIDADVQLTVIAGTLYRLLALRLGTGCERLRARTLFRKFVQAAATVEILSDRIEVRFGRRANNPALVQAGFADQQRRIPWLGNLPLRLVFR